MTNTNVTYVNGTLTITKAPLKIKAKNYTIEQGDPLPTVEIEYEGFKNNETEEVLIRKPKVTIEQKSTSSDHYDIIVSDAEAQNYDIIYINGTLTTGIITISTDSTPFDVYNLQGRKVRHQVTSLDGLPKGVYIVNGNKVIRH